MKRRYSLLLIASIAMWPAHAQQSSAPSEELRISATPKVFLRDEVAIWKSVIHKDTYKSRAFLKYGIPFAAMTATLLATDRKISNALPNTDDQIKWSGRISNLGEWYSLVGLSGGTYIVGHFTKNAKAREAGWLSLEALGHAQIVVFALKQITNRTRPGDSDQQLGFWKGGNSFPSGHAASSFAVASVFAREYQNHISVGIAAYSLAGLISLSRVSARRHWVSDVAVGGSLGFLFGRFTYKRNHHVDGGSSGGERSKAVPDIGFAGSEAILAWSL